MDKRFDIVYAEGSSLASCQRIVLVDRETGVTTCLCIWAPRVD